MSRALFFACGAFVLGILAGSLVLFPAQFFLGLATAALFFCVFAPRSRVFAYVALCMLSFGFGAFHYTATVQGIAKNPITVLAKDSKEVSFEARVAKEPKPSGKSTLLVAQPLSVPEGKVQIRTDAYSSYAYGDVIVVTGKLELAPMLEEFNYRQFLEKDEVFAVMNNPAIETREHGRYSSGTAFAYAALLNVKERFRDVIFAAIPPPESIIMGALLLGDQGKIDADMKDKLNRTGLRHIIAISGQHIVILTSMVMAFGLGIGLWRKQAIVLAAVCMVLFILLTGAEASSVRAGIMGGIFLLGQYVGRGAVTLRQLALAAAFMLLFNPLLLVRDIGFQLSFLAVWGIAVAFPVFERLLYRVPNIVGLRDIVAMNVAAQVFTVPVLVYNFGYVSVVGFLTNILVLPVIPFLTGFGFVFVVAGSLWSLLGTLLSFPVLVLSQYFHFVIEFFASFPFTSLQLEHVPLLWLFFLYIPALLLLWKLQKQKEPPLW